jgi:hypothetical protein
METSEPVHDLLISRIKNARWMNCRLVLSFRSQFFHRRVQHLQPQLAEHESDAQRVARRQRQLAVDLADLRIDQRPGASVRAPNRYDWQAPEATCSKLMTAA